MSQVPDLESRESAAAAIRPNQPGSLHNLSDAMLADEHRGQSFAKRNAETRLKAIEAELERRGLDVATGALGQVKRTDTLGLIDLKRLRAERPDIAAAYAQPGSLVLWISRTLTPEERASAGAPR